IGFDALTEVDPGGHFFATAHTMDRYQTAFYEPLVAVQIRPPLPKSRWLSKPPAQLKKPLMGLFYWLFY
ncbi:MAG: trimethylamine methyltransferase family protein, partial [Pseudomonadota bacterium]